MANTSTGLLIFVVVSVLIIAAVIYYFQFQRLKKTQQERQTLANTEQALNLQLALKQQALEQLQQQYDALKLAQAEAQQYSKDLLASLQSAEKNNQALAMEMTQNQALSEQKLAQFEENRQQLKVEFENLANRVLDEKSKIFTHSNQSSIESLLKPFREQIESFQKRVNDVHTDSMKGTAALESEIKKVLDIGLKMGKEAENLTSALKNDPQKRGAWGEGQLERTLEMSGLIAGTHFEKQPTFKDAEGRRKQPDYLINLPGEKQILIDSKVSLVAYDQVLSASTPELQKIALSAHASAVKQHIDDLSGKDYTNLVGVQSPNFVLMFMPIEPAYIEALKHEKDLFLYGYEKNIVLVSHTTLIPILRTVANLWMLEQGNTHAREISQKAGEIFNQVCEVAIRLQKLGGSLNAASNHYNDTLTALTGRRGLYGKVERFSQLSTKASKSMPVMEPLESEFKQQIPELQSTSKPIAEADAESNQTESNNNPG